MNPELQKCRAHYELLGGESQQRKTAQHLLTAIQIAEKYETALEGALVLADCLADTKDDPETFKGNNDNYMRIKDALARVTKPEGK